MDKMFSNVQITPSLGVTSPKEDSKTENTEPQDKCESNLVNESDLFVIPLDEKETNIPVQPKPILSSLDCENNLQSNEIQTNISYGQHLLNLPISEERGITFFNNTSGAIAYDNLVHTDQTHGCQTMPDWPEPMTPNAVGNNRFDQNLVCQTMPYWPILMTPNAVGINRFNQNQGCQTMQYWPIPMTPNADANNEFDQILPYQMPLEKISIDQHQFKNLNSIDIQNETSVYTNKVINTELIDMACNVNMENFLLTDEISKEHSGAFNCISTSDCDDTSCYDNEVLNKQIKLSMDTLDQSKGDLDEMIERSINNNETFSADKSILATPSTVEKSSETSSPLSDPRKNRKRCLFFNDESNQSKRMKYSYMRVNDSSNKPPDNKTSEENNMSPFRLEITCNNILPPREVTIRFFDKSVSQYVITPATVPGLTEEESDKSKSESEKTTFSDEDSESDENLNRSTELSKPSIH